MSGLANATASLAASLCAWPNGTATPPGLDDDLGLLPPSCCASALLAVSALPQNTSGALHRVVAAAVCEPFAEVCDRLL